jgi:hypothetical protein
MPIRNVTRPAPIDHLLSPSNRKPHMDFIQPTLSFTFYKKYLEKFAYFSNFYYHTSLQEFRVRGASIARISQVRVTAMMLLGTVGN